MVKAGKGKEELFESLSSLGKVNRRYLSSGEDVSIHATLNRGEVSAWELMSPVDGKEKSLGSGSSLSSLIRKLSNMQTEETLNVAKTTVLALKKTETETSIDGKVTVTWYEFTPGIPYTLENGVPTFETIERKVSKSDLKVLEETRLAFFQEDCIYAITKESAKAVGSLFQASKLLDSEIDPFVAGLFLASSLKKHRDVSFLVSEGNETVKPILNIVGKGYCLIDQEAFIRKVLMKLSTVGPYDVTDWKMTESNTVVHVVFPMLLSGRLGATIEVGNGYATPAKLTGTCRFKEATMILFTKSVKHDIRYTEKGIENLMDGVAEQFHDFVFSYEETSETIVDVEKILKKVKPFMGKKREALFDEISSCHRPLEEAITELMEICFSSDVKERQREALDKVFTETWNSYR